ncbi:hypothetical protein HOD88_03530 [archaeon]|jgi:hypothetical protein|nr:hypothetical protein [archaeon]
MSEQGFLKILGLKGEDYCLIARNIRRMINTSSHSFRRIEEDAIAQFNLDTPERRQAIIDFKNDLSNVETVYEIAGVKWENGLPPRETYMAIYDHMLRHPPEDSS